MHENTKKIIQFQIERLKQRVFDNEEHLNNLLDQTLEIRKDIEVYKGQITILEADLNA